MVLTCSCLLVDDHNLAGGSHTSRHVGGNEASSQSIENASKSFRKSSRRELLAGTSLGQSSACALISALWGATKHISSP